MLSYGLDAMSFLPHPVVSAQAIAMSVLYLRNLPGVGMGRRAQRDPGHAPGHASSAAPEPYSWGPSREGDSAQSESSPHKTIRKIKLLV